MDLFGRGKIMLNQCSLLVIDEADRMLDMGFIPDIEEICTKLPSPRQTLLFSATMPPPIKKLADKFMTEPRLIEVARPASTNTSITQYVVETSPRGKREALRGLLKDPEVRNAIIFCNRKRDIKELVDSLKRAGFAVSQIHGDMEQSDRIRELERFKSGDINIIVASDVAARGLDIPGVSHVVNYDVPHHAEDYVHRIGRTGRAGRTGIAYTLATEADAENLAEVEKLIRQKIQRYGEAKADAAPAAAEPVAAPPKAPAELEAVEDDLPARKRRRGGRGRKREAGEADPVVASPAPRVAEARAPERKPEARQPETRAPEPARPAPRAAAPARREPARDPIRDYRGGRRDEGRRDDRRDRDEGESFIGFGPEGVPAFLTHKATIER
jgi:superfamily II DNA/RNA helicase